MKNQVIRFLAFCIISSSSLLTVKAQEAQQPAAVNQQQQMTPSQRMDMRVNKMKQELNLTDEQVTKLKALFLARHSAKHGKDDADSQGNLPKLSDELAKILTPEQITKLKQLRKEQKRPPIGAPPKEQNGQGQ